ncbi:hypothetical protein GA0115254_111535 [Streptomyces sp. Ncost-T10-10d]|nr:hypothetical protein [Streptomyces sp. Ncost-T10-10d]SCF68095.1 hypothetical protein GA0115254_111535 [Streptomyces sp. Ncost-T10-10d]
MAVFVALGAFLMTLAGGWVAQRVTDRRHLVLGFFGGALLYLAAAEILPEAHHEHPARSTLLCTVAGVGFIWLVVGIAD